MAIESDDQNADSRLMVRFYSEPVKNEFESIKEGRPIYNDVDMIHISIPGDPTFDSKQVVREDHKARFPRHWAHFQNMHGDDPKLTGTPLTQWALISPSMAEELRALQFKTVESIATASDSQLQSIGMKAGMNAFSFRTRAQNFLKSAQDESIVAQQHEELEKLRQENASIKAETDAKLAQMQEQMAQILAAVGTKPDEEKTTNKLKLPQRVSANV